MMVRTRKQRAVDSGVAGSNPFDSDSESDPKQNVKGTKNSATPVSSKPNSRITPTTERSDDEAAVVSLSSSSAASSHSSGARRHYRNGFRDAGGLDNQTTQELESYAVYKAEEVTKDVNACLKIAEEIKDNATNTLVTLHQQGEQISRTHYSAANMDHDLSRGEKLLGSLGGIFSKKWKPKKTRAITGPKISRDDSFKRRANHLEQKEKMGLMSNQKKPSTSQQKLVTEPTTALEKVQVEKAKQDDALFDLSHVLEELKDMAVDMGSEIARQNKALDHLDEDVEELNFRVKGANQRGRRLLGK